MAKGWYWRGNVAHYDFEVDGDRYRGSLGIKKDSGVLDGKSPSERADIETRALKVQYEQGHSIKQIWEQTQKRMLGRKQVQANFQDIWDVFKKNGMSTAGAGRTRIYNAYLETFCGWLFENHPTVKTAAQITENIAKEYISVIRAQDGASATKNEKLMILKMIFSALDLPVNPFEKIRPLKTSFIPREIFTPDQIRILFEKSSGWLYTLFVTALATFQREGDCCLIKKSYISLERNRITFPFTNKTKQPVSLPMVPLFRELVEKALADTTNKSEYLFPELAVLYMRNKNTISSGVKNFLAEQNFGATNIEVPGYSKKVSILDVHSLRHTAAVLAILSGWPLPMVMKATGHRSLKTVMRYLDHITEEQKENYFFQFGQKVSFAGPVKEQDIRKELADLAYSLPLEEVSGWLQQIKAKKALPLS